LLTRTFFGLKKPWMVTWLSVGNLAINVGVSLLLLPLGIAGVVIGTAVADAAMAAAQFWLLRRELGGRLELSDMYRPLFKMLVAAAAFGGVAYGVWVALDQALSGSTISQIIEVGTALAAGTAIYAVLVLLLRVPEALTIRRIVLSRLRA
jgi:putative peptidoglycan lipid II flippase